MSNTGELPRISVVTPVFNQASHLEETINSVLSQNYPNLEYIIMDGGSTDGSVEIIQRYAAHLAYWHSGPDDGHYDAVNQGFAKAGGEVFTWLNGDDLHFPWTLKVVGEVMRELPEVQWLSTLMRAVADATGCIAAVLPVGGFAVGAFLDGFYGGANRKGHIQQESTFFRRSLWEKAGGRIRPSYRLGGDYDLWAQFFQRGAQLFGIDVPLGMFRRRAGQRSEDADGYHAQTGQALAELRRASHWIADPKKAESKKLKYAGRKIVRSGLMTAHPVWAIKDHSFSMSW